MTTGGNMQVETRNASLDTLAVTIQALHVSGKQMTLAVFRQLPIASALNSDSSLIESLALWGLVRYQIKDEASLWVVASADGVLYRCVAEPYRISSKFHLDDIAQAEALLKDYIEWEPIEIAYEAAEIAARKWYDIPAEERIGKRPTAPHAPYRRGYRIGTVDAFQQSVIEAKLSLEVSLRHELSVRKLSMLPQLFIAV